MNDRIRLLGNQRLQLRDQPAVIASSIDGDRLATEALYLLDLGIIGLQIEEVIGAGCADGDALAFQRQFFAGGKSQILPDERCTGDGDPGRGRQFQQISSSETVLGLIDTHRNFSPINYVYRLNGLMRMDRNEFPKERSPGERVDGTKAHPWPRFPATGNDFGSSAVFRAVRWVCSHRPRRTYTA